MEEALRNMANQKNWDRNESFRKSNRTGREMQTRAGDTWRRIHYAPARDRIQRNYRKRRPKQTPYSPKSKDWEKLRSQLKEEQEESEMLEDLDGRF